MRVTTKDRSVLGCRPRAGEAPLPLGDAAGREGDEVMYVGRRPAVCPKNQSSGGCVGDEAVVDRRGASGAVAGVEETRAALVVGPHAGLTAAGRLATCGATGGVPLGASVNRLHIEEKTTLGEWLPAAQATHGDHSR